MIIALPTSIVAGELRAAIVDAVAKDGGASFVPYYLDDVETCGHEHVFVGGKVKIPGTFDIELDSIDNCTLSWLFREVERLNRELEVMRGNSCGVALGAWEYEGKIILDVSDVIPTRWVPLQTALDLAKARGERAVYSTTQGTLNA